MPPPEPPPPALRRALDRFAREHPSWRTREGAWRRAGESPSAFLAAAAAAGAGRGDDLGILSMALFNETLLHHVARVGDWIVDTSAPRFRPLDPMWPRAIHRKEMRRHYQAPEFSESWAPTPCPRSDVLEWARSQRVELVPDAPLLHVAMRDRRHPEMPVLAAVLLGLPADGTVAKPGARVAEVAPLWIRHDDASLDAANFGIQRALRAARAMGYTSVIGHASLDEEADPGGPFGPDQIIFPSQHGWKAEHADGFPTFLRPREGRKGERVKAVRQTWANERHMLRTWEFEEALEAFEEEQGRNATDLEASDIAYKLGMYDHGIDGWGPPRAGDVDVPEDSWIRYVMDFPPQRGTLSIAPLSRGEAHAFIDDHHAHHWAPTGEVFALGVFEGGSLRCAGTLGRPTSRRIQDQGPWIAEVTRVACARAERDPKAPGGHAPNFASKLLGAMAEAAEALGYSRITSYTLAREKGSSYRGANWRPVALGKGGEWGRQKRGRTTAQPGAKVRWEIGPDAIRPSPEEATRIEETLRSEVGKPVPPRPPPTSLRFIVKRVGKQWVAWDKVGNQKAPGNPKSRREAEKVVKELERARRKRQVGADSA